MTVKYNYVCAQNDNVSTDNNKQKKTDLASKDSTDNNKQKKTDTISKKTHIGSKIEYYLDSINTITKEIVSKLNKSKEIELNNNIQRYIAGIRTETDSINKEYNNVTVLKDSLKKENDTLTQQVQHLNNQIPCLAKLVAFPVIIDTLSVLGVLGILLFILYISGAVEIKFKTKKKNPKNVNKNTEVNPQQSDFLKQTYKQSDSSKQIYTNNENDNKIREVSTGSDKLSATNTAPENTDDTTDAKSENETPVTTVAVEPEIIGYAIGVEPESNIQFKSEILVSAASPPENDKCCFIFKRQANGDITVEYNIENKEELISYRYRYLSSKIAEYVGEHEIEIKDIIPLKPGKVTGDIESGFKIAEKIKIKLV